MYNPDTLPAREAQAQREIGVTTISRRGAAALAAVLGVLLAIGTGVQLVRDRTVLIEPADFARVAAQAWRDAAGHPWRRLFAANRALLRTMDDWETRLEDTAWFHDPLLAVGQPLLWRVGSGNGQAVRGRDGWLFYQPDVDYLTAAPFAREAPLTTILDFQAQLAARGIHLLVVPVPVKPQVHPDALTARAPTPPLRNPAEADLLASLRDNGVAVLELAEPLVRFAAAHGPAYLQTDTHWSPPAMREAARLAADAMVSRAWVSRADRDAIETTTESISHVGDIAAMLSLPPEQRLIPPETVTHTRIAFPTDVPSQVLLLGDSFSNIYSLEAMGWGTSGGFGEQLGDVLGQPVATILRNDAGALATREALAVELARGRDRLAGIRVVVWQFAMREFRGGDWRPVALAPVDAPAGPAPAAGLIEGDRRLTARATVAAVSAIPRPGQVPYADHVATVHLRDIVSDDGSVTGAQAAARFLSMRDHHLQPGSRWTPGTRLRVSLIPFAAVEDRYGGLNTSTLDDMDLMLVEPFWIEEVLP